MQVEIQNKIEELEANREAVASELDRIDAKIEVLKEMIFAAPSNNGTPKSKPNFSGLNKIQTVQKLIEMVGPRFCSTEIIAKARELDAPLTDNNVYAAIQSMGHAGQIRSAGAEGGSGTGRRKVTMYKLV